MNHAPLPFALPAGTDSVASMRFFHPQTYSSIGGNSTLPATRPAAYRAGTTVSALVKPDHGGAEAGDT
jgi:hypothetical protein